MIVKDIMSSHVATIGEHDSVYDAAKVMRTYDVGVVPVTAQNNKICGMITDRDIVLRCIVEGKDAKSCKASEIMSSSTICANPNQSLAEALQMMSHQQVRRLPVTENGSLKGIVSLADIARIRTSAETANALTEISMP